MTRRPYLDERDPAEPREWVETSSKWHREEAKRMTAEAVRKAKAKEKGEQE